MPASKNVKITGFILLEIILYFAFLYIDIFESGYSGVSSVIKFIGIAGCFCYTLFGMNTFYNNIFKSNRDINRLYIMLIRWALFFTLISDVFLLLLTNESEKGVFTFIIVQGIYRYYLWHMNKQIGGQGGRLRFLYSPNIFLGCLVLLIMYFLMVPVNLLLCITVFYFVSIVLNVITAIRLAVRIRTSASVIFAIGMILFLLCDINVGIYNMADFILVDKIWFKNIYGFSTIGMWLFYLPAQVLLATHLSFIKNNKKDCIRSKDE